MTALGRIEARHLARSPLLWMGFGLALALMTLNQVPFMSWPVLSADDLHGYQAGYLLSGGALLAGAWLGLRDGLTGAADLVAVTPTAPWRLWRARLASVAAVAAGLFAAAFTTALAVSAVRGGRGTPDLRLLADGALAVTLAGWVGVAVGRRSRSRMVSLLAAPVWVAGCVIVGGGPAIFGSNLALAVSRLSPLLAINSYDTRSAEFGFLPDPLWPHLGYLLGLVLLAGVGLLALAGRGGGQRLPGAPVLAGVLAGVVLVAVGGVGVVTLPDQLVVLGPDRADWKPLSEVETVVLDPTWTYPDDGHARACAGDATLTACVYPAYGRRLAQEVRDAVQPLAELFAGLPGVPTRVRMVPTQDFVQSSCRGTEVQIGEPDARAVSRDDRDGRFLYMGGYLRCALGEVNWGVGVDGLQPPSEALDAVKVWALLASGTVTGDELRRSWAQEGHPNPIPITLPTLSPEVVAAAEAMAALPPARVRAELAPVWEELRAGRLPLAELPGQQP